MLPAEIFNKVPCKRSWVQMSVRLEPWVSDGGYSE